MLSMEYIALFMNFILVIYFTHIANEDNNDAAGYGAFISLIVFLCVVGNITSC